MFTESGKFPDGFGMMHEYRWGALLFLKVLHQISRSHETKKDHWFWRIWRCRTLSFNSPMALKWCTKLNVAKKMCPIFQGHISNFKVTGGKNINFEPNWAFSDCNFSLSSLMDLKWCTIIFQVIHQISTWHRLTIDDLNPIWLSLVGQSQLSNPTDLPCSYLRQGFVKTDSISCWSQLLTWLRKMEMIFLLYVPFRTKMF